MGEHLPCKQGVDSSSLFISTKAFGAARQMPCKNSSGVLAGSLKGLPKSGCAAAGRERR